MKKIILLSLLTVFSFLTLSAQVKIQSPHPDLHIEIQNCKYSNGNVYIEFIMTNNGTTEGIVFSKGITEPWHSISRAYDNEGHVYTSKSVIISTLPVEYSRNKNDNTVYSFPTNRPVFLKTVITEVCDYATKFERLDIVMSSSGAMKLSGKYPIRFYNLEWAK